MSDLEFQCRDNSTSREFVPNSESNVLESCSFWPSDGFVEEWVEDEWVSENDSIDELLLDELWEVAGRQPYFASSLCCRGRELRRVTSCLFWGGCSSCKSGYTCCSR